MNRVLARKSKIEEVREEVLLKIKPSGEEVRRVSRTVSEVIGRLKSIIRRLGVDAYPELEGSVAHHTWITGGRDIDIFILFPLITPLDEIKKLGMELGKQVSEGNWIERYAEHPFIEATIDGYRIDIVPCYRITNPSDRVTSVDRTPLHTEYLSHKMKERERDETILLKAFMKGIGVYGAELRTNGFSGYLCELLTIHYGSFEECLRGALRWTAQEVIDIEEHYSGKDTPRKIFSEPLILIDPVDPTRNVAAAVSVDRIADLKAAARAFSTNPSVSFFQPKKVQPLSGIELSHLFETRGTDTLFIQLPCYRLSPDIVWGELRKSSKALKKLLELHDFQVVNWDSWSDEEMMAVLVIELVSSRLPSIKVHDGPPAGDSNQRRFIEKHLHNEKTIAGPWIKDGKWRVELRRDYTEAKYLVETKIREEEPAALGFSKDVGKWIKEGGKVFLNREILPTYSANQIFAEFLSKYYTKRPDWLV